MVSQKYLEEGYVSASIVFEQSLLERWMGSKGGTFVVREGPRYTLGALVFTEPRAPAADTLADPAALAALTPLAAGKPFRTEEIRAHIEAITARYEGAGFATVNVVPLTTIEPDSHTVSITFEIERGARTPTSRQPN